jgi:hypothetical protein
MSEIVSTNNFFNDKYLSNYNNFVEQLKIIFSGDETHQKLNELNNLPDEQKVVRGILFSEAVSDEHFSDFTKSKIKIFSHKSPDTQKISESLFGENFCLKNLLNNQPEEVKTIIWTNLHNILLVAELLKSEEDRNTTRISVLSNLLYKNTPEALNENCEQSKTNFSNASSNAKNKLKDMLGVEVNDDTTGMIDDIVSSFEGILTGTSGGNPFAGIMEVSQKISVKYADKINKGEIELDKLMKSISSKVPGMESVLGGMGGMMGGASGDKPKSKEKIIIDENFSTADIAVGMNKEEDKPGINFGNVLKMADQFGVIPGGKQSESSMPNLSALGDIAGMAGMAGMGGMGDMPNIGKIMEIMQKLEKTETKEDADALKQEMDSFLQKELGVDIEKLNKDLDSVQTQMANSNPEQN